MIQYQVLFIIAYISYNYFTLQNFLLRDETRFGEKKKKFRTMRIVKRLQETLRSNVAFRRKGKTVDSLKKNFKPQKKTGISLRTSQLFSNANLHH